MDDSRFLQCLSADYGDLRDAATAVELTAPHRGRPLAVPAGFGRVGAT